MSNQAQQPAARKRKASTDLPPDFSRPIQNDPSQAPANKHTQQHISVKEISGVYEQTYLDTIDEIKHLLQYYAFVLAADANSDLNLDGTITDGNIVSPDADTNAMEVQDAKTELKAILDDLASKPELVGMEEVRQVLMDCGIVVDLLEGPDGERVVDLRLL